MHLSHSSSHRISLLLGHLVQRAALRRGGRTAVSITVDLATPLESDIPCFCGGRGLAVLLAEVLVPLDAKSARRLDHALTALDESAFLHRARLNHRSSGGNGHLATSRHAILSHLTRSSHCGRRSLYHAALNDLITLHARSFHRLMLHHGAAAGISFTRRRLANRTTISVVHFLQGHGKASAFAGNSGLVSSSLKFGGRNVMAFLDMQRRAQRAGLLDSFLNPFATFSMATFSVISTAGHLGHAVIASTNRLAS